jgi:hypothetical protein
MADQTTVHIGENSPEQIAYKMLVHVAAAEGFHLRSGPTSDAVKPTREYILDTYAECWIAAKGGRALPKKG